MNLATATHYAQKLSAWLAPHAERIQIAGSVRRQRPHCNDIDLVIIPRRIPHLDLFGNTTHHTIPLHQFLTEYVRDSAHRPSSIVHRGQAAWLQGEHLQPDTKQLILQLPKCQLDIFLATETTWATRLLARTGSKSHNIWLATQAQKAGLHWNPNEGLALQNAQLIPTPTEEHIYAALNLDYRPPTQRDL